MKNNKNPIKNIKDASTSRWSKVTAGWKPYVEHSIPLEDLDEIMERCTKSPIPDTG